MIFTEFCCTIDTEGNFSDFTHERQAIHEMHERHKSHKRHERKEIIMVRIIIGLKGSGKTKHLIELANKAVETSPGNVVCIEKGNKLMFDILRQVRLVDTDLFGINNADQLYGMVCGIISANYDIKDISRR